MCGKHIQETPLLRQNQSDRLCFSVFVINKNPKIGILTSYFQARRCVHVHMQLLCFHDFKLPVFCYSPSILSSLISLRNLDVNLILPIFWPNAEHRKNCFSYSGAALCNSIPGISIPENDFCQSQARLLLWFFTKLWESWFQMKISLLKVSCKNIISTSTKSLYCFTENQKGRKQSYTCITNPRKNLTFEGVRTWSPKCGKMVCVCFHAWKKFLKGQEIFVSKNTVLGQG